MCSGFVGGGWNTLYSVAILDDQHEEGLRLLHMLEELPVAGSLDIEVFTEPSSFVGKIEAGLVPDIAFIDIKLEEDGPANSSANEQGTALAPPSPTGIDIVSRLAMHGTLSTQVVYMSGYDNYHTSVYRTRHAAYLKKPFEAASVQEALARALQGLTHYENETPIMVRFGDVVRPVRPRDISYVESRLRKVHFTVGGEQGESLARLGEVQKLLPERFVRCHQSFLVNLDYLSGFSGADAVLFNGTRIPVSRRYRTSVHDALIDYVRSAGA